MKCMDNCFTKVSEGILLHANESYQNLSEELLKDFQRDLPQILFHRYPDSEATHLCKLYGKHFDLNPSQVLVGNGSDEVIGLIIGLYITRGSKLLTLQPDFDMYDFYTAFHDGIMVKFSPQEEFDVDAFIRTGKQEQVSMVIFSNPNNPTGRVFEKEDLKKIIRAFDSIPVIIDEAYGEFCDNSVVEWIDTYPNLYVTRTLSKAYGLAAIRCGVVLSSSSNIQQLHKVKPPYNVNSLTQYLAARMLHDHPKTLPVVEEIKIRRDEFYEKICQYPHITVYPSGANFIFCRSPKKQELLDAFQPHTILIRSYEDDSFRITIGQEDEMNLVCRIMDEVLR